MSKSESVTRRMPGIQGFQPVPIHSVDHEVPLRICVLARRESDPVSGHFVLLRTASHGRTWLGCILDVAGTVHEWVEIWVQGADPLEGSIPALRELLTNDGLEKRWLDETAALEKLDGQLVHIGWEAVNPPPILLDLEKGELVRPGGQERWELCTDDAALKTAGLPVYHGSLCRYLWQPSRSENRKFLPVTPNAPQNENTITRKEAYGDAAWVSFNEHCGLMRVTRFAPFELGEYLDLLGGKAWKGTELGKSKVVFDTKYAGLNDWEHIQQNDGFLFLGHQGKKAAAVETLYLKLQLFTEAVRTARAWTEHQQLPFLNLTTASFRVRLARVGKQLPVFWSAQVLLAQTGGAYPAPVQSTEARYFIRAGGNGEQVFLPDGISRKIQGAGNVRLRQVLAERNGTVVEGTVEINEREAISPHDLFWIQLPLAARTVTLYGHVYREDSLAAGEARFRTLPQTISPEIVQALKQAEGAAFPKSPFEILPALSSPCDLYSLGVVGVRALLVNAGNSLPVALDELLSLGREAGALKETGRPLNVRVREVMEADARFQKALGVHRVVQNDAADSNTAAVIPAEFWYDVLACLIRFFPGGADAYCKDSGRRSAAGTGEYL